MKNREKREEREEKRGKRSGLDGFKRKKMKRTKKAGEVGLMVWVRVVMGVASVMATSPTLHLRRTARVVAAR